MRLGFACALIVTAPFWVACSGAGPGQSAVQASSGGNAAAVTASADRFGVNAHRPKGDEAKFLFDKVTESGVGWVRLDVVWEKIEHAPGKFDWSEADEPIREASSRGLKVFANLHATPGWANGNRPDTVVPKDSATWASFCSQVVRRYDGSTPGLPRVDVFGIWNEPDGLGIGERGDKSKDKLNAYVDKILKPCSKAIREARSDARTAGPDLASEISFLKKVLERAGDSLDIITVHKYSDKPAGVLAHMDSVRSLVNGQSEWKNKPIWLTETGWATHEPKGCSMDTVDEKGQAKESLDLLKLVETRQWIQKIFFYELMDDTKSQGACGWGMLRGDKSEKPWFAALKNYLKSSSKGSGKTEKIGSWLAVNSADDSGLKFASSGDSDFEAVLARSSVVRYFVKNIDSGSKKRIERSDSFRLNAMITLTNESYDGTFSFGLVDKQNVQSAQSLIGLRVREPEAGNRKGSFRVEATVSASNGERKSSEVILLPQGIRHELKMTWKGKSDGSGVLSGTVGGKSFRVEQGPRAESYNALGVGVGLDSDSNAARRTGKVRFSDIHFEAFRP